MPALRERSGNITVLVRYFVRRFAKQMNRRIEMISQEVMSALELYQWPGNIRELEKHDREKRNTERRSSPICSRFRTFDRGLI